VASLCSILTIPCSSWQADSPEVKAVKRGGTPYFTTKMENLTTKLELTPDQQAKLKLIAEQEVSLLEEMRGNSRSISKGKACQTPANRSRFRQADETLALIVHPSESAVFAALDNLGGHNSGHSGKDAFQLADGQRFLSTSTCLG